jgi:hypothetical protein
MADCYYHGYSGSYGGCTQCEREEREHICQGTLGNTIPIEESKSVMEAANISSLGRSRVIDEKNTNSVNKT